jgi:hypothetical protein
VGPRPRRTASPASRERLRRRPMKIDRYDFLRASRSMRR